jgi:preprotein translocase subunit YajC
MFVTPAYAQDIGGAAGSGRRRGDQVVTSGGLLAKVTKVGDGDEVEVEIATGVKVKLIRSTITAVLSKTEPANDN